MLVAVSVFAALNELDPCALIGKAELAKTAFGEIKEGPVTKTGPAKEKMCEWTNINGSWLRVMIFPAEQLGLKKGLLPNEPTAISGLGDEAFSAKRGTDSEVYVRKGDNVVEVDTSSGAAVAKTVAEMAVKKLP